MKEPPTEAALLLHLFKNAVAVRNVFILHVAKGRKQVQCNGDVAPVTTWAGDELLLSLK